jgi:hypothetical protein
MHNQWSNITTFENDSPKNISFEWEVKKNHAKKSFTFYAELYPYIQGQQVKSDISNSLQITIPRDRPIWIYYTIWVLAFVLLISIIIFIVKFYSLIKRQLKMHGKALFKILIIGILISAGSSTILLLLWYFEFFSLSLEFTIELIITVIFPSSLAATALLYRLAPKKK